MLDIESFSETFGSDDENPYDSRTIDSITRHRRLLENMLFFDRLLTAVDLDEGLAADKNRYTSSSTAISFPARKHYPPSSYAELRTLHNLIISAPSTDTQKAALLYYMRKDINLKASEFAEETYLPPRYIILINGLWHLDRARCKEALKYLTEPTLIPTFPEEILYTIAKQSPNHPELVLQYYNTTNPVLTSSKVMKAYFSALANSSVTEAFFFTRKQPDAVRRGLLEMLGSRVHGSSSGSARAERSVELVGLPFDEQEEEWFEEYLLRGDGKGLYGAKDTVIVRRMATGRGADVGGLAKEVKERKIDGINWLELARGLAVE